MDCPVVKSSTPAADFLLLAVDQVPSWSFYCAWLAALPAFHQAQVVAPAAALHYFHCLTTPLPLAAQALQPPGCQAALAALAAQAIHPFYHLHRQAAVAAVAALAAHALHRQAAF